MTGNRLTIVQNNRLMFYQKKSPKCINCICFLYIIKYCLLFSELAFIFKWKVNFKIRLYFQTWKGFLYLTSWHSALAVFKKKKNHLTFEMTRIGDKTSQSLVQLTGTDQIIFRFFICILMEWNSKKHNVFEEHQSGFLSFMYIFWQSQKSLVKLADL